jgi:hypothetical protein
MNQALTKPPKVGTDVYISAPDLPVKFSKQNWVGGFIQDKLLSHGLVFRDEKSAIQHSLGATIETN